MSMDLKPEAIRLLVSKTAETRHKGVQCEIEEVAKMLPNSAIDMHARQTGADEKESSKEKFTMILR